MTAHPPPGYSAADTAAGVRAGELSASQIVKESLDRIRASAPTQRVHHHRRGRRYAAERIIYELPAANASVPWPGSPSR